MKQRPTRAKSTLLIAAIALIGLALAGATGLPSSQTTRVTTSPKATMKATPRPSKKPTASARKATQKPSVKRTPTPTRKPAAKATRKPTSRPVQKPIPTPTAIPTPRETDSPTPRVTQPETPSPVPVVEFSLCWDDFLDAGFPAYGENIDAYMTRHGLSGAETGKRMDASDGSTYVYFARDRAQIYDVGGGNGAVAWFDPQTGICVYESLNPGVFDASGRFAGPKGIALGMTKEAVYRRIGLSPPDGRFQGSNADGNLLIATGDAIDWRYERALDENVCNILVRFRFQNGMLAKVSCRYDYEPFDQPLPPS